VKATIFRDVLGRTNGAEEKSNLSFYVFDIMDKNQILFWEWPKIWPNNLFNIVILVFNFLQNFSFSAAHPYFIARYWSISHDAAHGR
jgi:hypothetical protein